MRQRIAAITMQYTGSLLNNIVRYITDDIREGGGPSYTRQA